METTHLNQHFFLMKMDGNNLLIHQKVRTYTFWKFLLVVGVIVSVFPLLALVFDLKGFDAKIFSALLKSVIPSYLFNTVVICILVEIGVIFIGSTIAWISAMYTFPLRRVLIFFQLLPLLVPSYISAIVWKDGFSPHGFMVKIFGTGVLNMPTFAMLILVLTCNLYPYVFIVLYALFINLPQSLIDVARNLSLHKRSLFRWVGLPFAKVSLIGTSLLVLMELLNGFWVYQYLGHDIIATGIIRVWRLYGNLSIAKVIALVVIIMVMLLVIVKNNFEQYQHRYLSTRSNIIDPHRIKGLKSIFALLWCSIPVVLGFLIPFIQLLVWAFPILVNNEISYNILVPVRNSLFMAGIVVIIQVPLAIMFSYAVRLCRSLFFKRCFFVLSLGYAIPSALVAILIISVIKWIDIFFPDIPIFSIMVNGGIYAMIAACVYRYIPIALTPISNGLHNANLRYEQSARSLGSTPWRTLFRICIPINKQYIITAIMLTIIDILKDIPIASILRPFNFDTLALKIYYLINDELLSQASVAGLLLVFSGVALTLPIYIGLIKKGEQVD